MTAEVQVPQPEATPSTSSEENGIVLPFDLDQQNDVTRAIVQQVLGGLQTINEANVLLREDNRTGVREIEKALGEYSGDNDEIKSSLKERDEIKEALKKLNDKVRNLYRVHVLNEDEVTEPDVDIEKVKASRTVVLNALVALKGFAELNKDQAVLEWIDSLQVPQVGREGTTIVGQKKARVLPTIDGKEYTSFGEAAKALSAMLEENVTSTDLNTAYAESGESKEFDFKGKTISVRPKPTKKELASQEVESNEATDDEVEDMFNSENSETS